MTITIDRDKVQLSFFSDYLIKVLTNGLSWFQNHVHIMHGKKFLGVKGVGVWSALTDFWRVSWRRRPREPEHFRTGSTGVF